MAPPVIAAGVMLSCLISVVILYYVLDQRGGGGGGGGGGGPPPKCTDDKAPPKRIDDKQSPSSSCDLTDPAFLLELLEASGALTTTRDPPNDASSTNSDSRTDPEKFSSLIQTAWMTRLGAAESLGEFDKEIENYLTKRTEYQKALEAMKTAQTKSDDTLHWC